MKYKIEYPSGTIEEVECVDMYKDGDIFTFLRKGNVPYVSPLDGQTRYNKEVILAICMLPGMIIRRLDIVDES